MSDGRMEKQMAAVMLFLVGAKSSKQAAFPAAPILVPVGRNTADDVIVPEPFNADSIAAKPF